MDDLNEGHPILHITITMHLRMHLPVGICAAHDLGARGARGGGGGGGGQRQEITA